MKVKKSLYSKQIRCDECGQLIELEKDFILTEKEPIFNKPIDFESAYHYCITCFNKAVKKAHPAKPQEIVETLDMFPDYKGIVAK